jgi:hypothetical protein
MMAACRAFSRRPDKCKSVRLPVPLSSTRAFPRCSGPWSTCLSSFSPRMSLRPRGSPVDATARDHGVVTRRSCRAHRDRRDAGSRGRLASRTRARRPLYACTPGVSKSCASAESQCPSLGAAEQVGRARANEGGADVVIHGFLSRKAAHGAIERQARPSGARRFLGGSVVVTGASDSSADVAHHRAKHETR